MSAVAVKPCPFCGRAEMAMIDEISDDKWAVCCNNCGAIGPGILDNGGDNIGARAIACWNARPGECLPSGIIEALNSGDGTYRP